MHVFAYGSLLWNPGFEAVGALPATLEGWSRRWCVASRYHRGTPERPGLVLGLVEGGTCAGVAYEIDRADVERVMRYLDARELAEDGYLPQTVEVTGPRGPMRALTYVADTRHMQSPCPVETMERFRTASGRSGSNMDYVRRTLRAMMDLPGGIGGGDSGLSQTNLSTLMNWEGIGHRTEETLQRNLSCERLRYHRTGDKAAWFTNTPPSTTAARPRDISRS